MHILRYAGAQGPRLGLSVDDINYDLSAVSSDFADISTWLALDDPVAAAQEALSSATAFPLPSGVRLFPPVDKQEVWASGVTYLRSKVARMGESETQQGGDCYDRVYEAERPELFFKANAGRVMGPGEAIRIRRDSTWNVPEPELVIVFSSSGTIVGHTIGNDVSSRSIEGENPLYLPQAKIYDGSCAMGPVITLRDETQDVWLIHLKIIRDGETLFGGETSTAQLQRTQEELGEYLFRELTFETGVFLFTGTGIVPPDDFTLHSGDVVSITIDGIGTLENRVA